MDATKYVDMPKGRRKLPRRRARSGGRDRALRRRGERHRFKWWLRDVLRRGVDPNAELESELRLAGQR